MKKGSTLVESIVAIAILLLATTISLNIGIIGTNSKKIRDKKNVANRVAYAIENEIKYNTTFKNLTKSFKDNKISYIYSDNTLEELVNTSILDLEIGEGIEIEKVKEILTSEDENMPVMELKVKIKDDDGGILCERKFIKSYWMEK
ncbi:type II secretion system protein [Clostridium sartagoforme]|uniref:type II secretion system protein n=1 Tax=Clostridium sartagoforme TaxID=84031 RepID=UPI0031E0F457